MSFTPIRPFERSANAIARAAVTIAMTRGGGRNQARVRLVLRPYLIGNLPWLVERGFVSVAVGRGDDAGSLRIASPGDFQLGLSPCTKRAKRPLFLAIPLFGDPVPGNHPATVCDFRIDENGGIIVTLPQFLRGKKAVPDPAPAAPDRAAAPVAPAVPAKAQSGKFSISGPSHAEVNARRVAAAQASAGST